MKEFPPYRLDVADQSLWRDDLRVPLTPKAFAVLQYLVERAGRLVTQNELLEALWPDTFVQPEVLKSQILDVRIALGDRAKEPRFIETLARRGYRFIARVRDSGGPRAKAEPASGKLVGRDSALEELGSSLAKASEGERQIVFVTGEQGIGKTSVVEAFLQELSGTGAEFARGQCLEGYGMVKEPYYPVLEALGHLSRGTKGRLLVQVLETHAPTWLIQLPALLTREHRDTLQRELLGATRERMIREICEAIEKLTEEITLVLLFEDLHWTDHSTVDLIAALAHRRSPARLLMLGTYRPVDIVVSQHPLKQVSHSLKGRRLAREIALSPLIETEVAEYLARQTGTVVDAPVQSLARWIRKQTEGNPLFMVTVIEHLLELGTIARNASTWTIAAPIDKLDISVPDTLRQMIELHIDRLTPEEQCALDAASVQGVVFSAAVAAGALEMDPESVEATYQNLARQNHIVRTASAERLPDGTFSQAYEFVHAAFRSVFYHRLAPARRAKLHRRFGETIESLRPDNRAEIAAELAGHFEQCAEWARAVQYLLLAARNAWWRFAYREAIAILEHTLQLAEKLPEADRIPLEIRILDNLAVLQHGLHDTARVIPTLETLAGRAAAYSMPAVEVHALVALAAMGANDDCRACLPLINRVESLIAVQKDPVAQAQTRAHCAAMRISMFGWNTQMAQEQAADVARVREGGDRLATALVVMDYCYAQWASSQYAESFRNAQQCLPALLEGGRMVRFLHGRDLMGTNLVLLGQWGKALDLFDQGIDDAQKNEAPLRRVMPLVFKAWAHLLAMDYNGVLEMCSGALPALDATFMRGRVWIGEIMVASAKLGLGHRDAALDRLLELRAGLDERPFMLGWYWRIPLQLNVVEACLAMGDLARARLEADRSLEFTLATAERTWQALAWELSARVAFQGTDDARAERDLKNALDAIEAFDVPLAAWRVHNTAAGAQRNIDLRASHLTRSRDIVQSLAKSLDSRPALQTTFLSSPVISKLIDARAFREMA